ncbi:MAG: DUF447 family protein [Planctomycetes bacterium]|nr:DUF447 family protein [Planctomycetota bacterium]
MIIEGVVSTIDGQGAPNIAPMGPLVSPDFETLLFRPFKNSRTYQNLKRHPQGVFHITDDVELIAQAALGEVHPPLRPAEKVLGWIIEGACRYFEFQVEKIDDRADRTSMLARVVAAGLLRDFIGFNRAKHAAVEAAILASRLGILPIEEIVREMERLEGLVRKTGGAAEERAFRLLKDHVEKYRARPPLPRLVEVRTGSRLHFGLFAPWKDFSRQHGGAGVMVAEPGVLLQAERAEASSAEGPLAARAEEAARKVLKNLAADPGAPGGIKVTVRAAAPEHAGLGTGTQLELAAARAAAALLGRPQAGAAELARLLGRGRRSAIGLHGFEGGGLLVDGGLAKDSAGAAAPLLARFEVPEGWPILLILPERLRGLSGRFEIEAFERLDRGGGPPERRRGLAAELCRLVLAALLPAAAEKDFAGFSRALGELGRKAGEVFEGAQGGRFASPEVEELLDWLRREGIDGAGQSSWGPAVFAFFDNPDRAAAIAASLRGRFGLAPAEVLLTRPLNRGAKVIIE